MTTEAVYDYSSEGDPLLEMEDQVEVLDFQYTYLSYSSLLFAGFFKKSAIQLYTYISMLTGVSAD